MTIDNSERAMNRSIRRQAMEARRALALLQERDAERGDPPRYLFVDGHAYMLASHAAEQMERCIADTRLVEIAVCCASIQADQEPA